MPELFEEIRPKQHDRITPPTMIVASDVRERREDASVSRQEEISSFAACRPSGVSRMALRSFRGLLSRSRDGSLIGR